MNRADYDLLKQALLRERRDCTYAGNRRDIQRLEHTVLTIAKALAEANSAFQPVTWILDACGVRSVAQLSAPARRDIETLFGTTRRETPIMSGDRSKQAHSLAQAVAARIGVNRWDVKAEYISPSRGYQIKWVNSLTWDQMRALIDELLATGRYPAMAGTHLDLYRSTGSRAWAARAIAAYREDTKLPEEVERRAARLRALDLQLGFEPTPAEASALEDYVRKLVDDTEDPERASDPADEPVIQRLMKAGQNSEYRMAALVLARDPVVFLGEMPDGVTPLRRRADGGAQ